MAQTTQEFPLKKVNDHGRAQKRRIKLTPDSFHNIKGKSSSTRTFSYDVISGITYNTNVSYKFKGRIIAGRP